MGRPGASATARGTSLSRAGEKRHAASLRVHRHQLLICRHDIYADDAGKMQAIDVMLGRARQASHFR